MSSAFIKNLLFVAAFVGIISIGGVTAQTKQISVGKRNSPFSPNPKKKVDAASTIAQSVESDANLSVPTSEIRPEIKTESEIASEIRIENEKSAVEVIPNNSGVEQSLNLENRSIASKTLEIAKRAGTTAISPTEIYKVGIGDVLFIGLQNAPPRETNYFTVLNDGTIDYPLAGEMVRVTDLTAEEIEDLLKEKIKLYENPQISVKIREHNSHVYTVLGLVEKPGEKYLQRESVPLYVVRAEAVAQSKVNRITIKRSGTDIQNIDLKDPKYAETLVSSGDIVEFGYDDSETSESRAPQFYYIGGDITAGGQKDFYRGITLTQAILASGGLKKSTVRKVIVRRKNEAGMLVPTDYDLRLIKDGKAIDPVLEAGDTIEIGN